MFSFPRDTSIYGATEIKVLKGLEVVRKRPAMYIGDAGDGTGLHNMVYEVVDNALEEALSGFATEIAVTLNADGSATVRDDGRGMPTSMHAENGISAAEAILTQLHAGNPYALAGSLKAVGVSIVNALSSRLELRTWRDGKERRVRFCNGVAEAPLAVVGPAYGRHRTEVTFWPSPEVFHTVTDFDHTILEGRLREMAFLYPGVQLVLADNRHPGTQQPHVMCYPDGVADFVRHLDRSKTPLLDAPIVIAGEQDGIGVEVAFWWNDSFHESVHCFTNAIPQRDGGTHLAGLRMAMARAICTETGIACQSQVAITGEDAREGLTAVLSVKVPDPKFSSQTKDKLVSCEVKTVVESIVGDQLEAWLKSHPAEATAIAGKALEAAMARSAALRTRAVRSDLGYLAAVRQAPEAYIGDAGDGTGLLNMIYEVLDYALDDMPLGFATEIAVSLNADGSATLRHNGHGFSTFVPDDGRFSQAESLATHPDGPVLRNRYRVPGNLERATLAAVNALSSCLEMRIWEDSQEHLVRFRDGVAEARIKVVGPAEGKQGMEITFWPSLEVFHPVTDFDYAALERRLHEVAAFNPGLRIVLEDRRPGGRRLERICHGGTADLVRFLDRSRKPLLDAPIVIRSEAGEDDSWIDLDNTDWLEIEVALWWNNGASEQIACYTDGLPRHEGGSQRDRLLAAVSRVFARYAQQYGVSDSPKVPIVGDDAHRGLTAVVALRRYAYRTPLSEAALDEMTAVVEGVVADQLSAWLEAHPRQAQAILAHARKAASGRAVCGFAQRLPAGRL